ncbi:SH3 domain-containing protein [Pseudovibrio sp. Tun.PSC04-5.I4]|uniref:SH3 domain-containing protein n=1 Tax=Pseudovibrio sp. Tun.PSC04-5.I4 TaxID=1798213 RepID=UPI00088CCA3A|nr:SH3 domain-containing protein [Pseudovibrio sp. Tun.PSC04-5.I4]SDR16718.1 Uncharacterized conserved protein YgiM, contains N-terminal SH3 domain, DUF1202 family [Pseudovibrio sp. Tun.PSC04-5.I4]
MKLALKFLYLMPVLTILAAVSLPFFASAIAQPQTVEFRQVIGIADGDSLNIRSGPGRNYQDFGDLKNGAIVKIYGFDASGRWAKLRVRGQDAYVSAKYLAHVQENSHPAPQPNGISLGAHLVTGIARDDPDGGLNVRRKPNRASRIKATLPLNTPVTVSDISADRKWSFIRSANGKGWVRNKYLVKALPRNGQSPELQPVEFDRDPQGWSLPSIYSVTGVSGGDKLWVRNKPSHKSASVSNRAPNDAIAVLAWLNNGWAKVSVGQNIGYVNGRFLKRGGGQHTVNGFPLGLTCAGTEPFWAFNFNADKTITFKRADRPNPRLAGLQMTAPSTETNSYPYSFRAGRFSGALDQEVCSDGMSDISYGWSLRLIRTQPNGTTANMYGCCRLP